MAIKVAHDFGTKGSSVTVNLAGTTTKATLFEDEAETKPLANPVTVSPNGWVFFAVAQGNYDLIESGNGTNRINNFAVKPPPVGTTLPPPDPAPADGTPLVWDATGKRPRGMTKGAALTAADASVIDTVYAAEEAAVLANLRTRVNELEARLRALGLLT